MTRSVIGLVDVLLLLAALLVQGRGCNEFLKGAVKNLLLTINQECPDGFREVFPRDYNISHHYSDSLLCDDDPCCIFRAAVVLSDSWSELLFLLWRQHLKYPIIQDLKRNLDKIAEQRFLIQPEPSALPSVMSSPEMLLNYTKAVFLKWLHDCPFTETSTCEFSVPGATLKEEEGNTVYSAYINEKNKHLSDQASVAGGTKAIPLSHSLLLALFPILYFTESVL